MGAPLSVLGLCALCVADDHLSGLGESEADAEFGLG